MNFVASSSSAFYALLIIAIPWLFWVIKSKTRLKRVVAILTGIATALLYLAHVRNVEVGIEKGYLIQTLLDANVNALQVVEEMGPDTMLVAYYSLVGIIFLSIVYIEVLINRRTTRKE